MKKIAIIIVLLGFVAKSTFATIIEGIEPVLNYAHDHELHYEKASNSYLSVVIENTRFPNYSVQEEKFELALSLLEEVLNSEEFKRKVLAYKRSSDGKRLYQKNYLWRDSSKRLTNEDVYNILMEGNEKMRPDTIAEMNINAKVRKCRGLRKIFSVWCRKVIGSTAPSRSAWMTLNWKFYRNYETHNMVANIVHEWIHLLGFLHGNEYMREEVPYVVGAIAGEVAENILSKK